MWCKSFINNIILSTQTFAPIVWHYHWFASGTLRRINTFFWVTLRVGHLRGFWRWIYHNLKRRDRATVSRRCSICDDTCLAKSLPVLIRACYVAAHTKWPWSRCVVWWERCRWWGSAVEWPLSRGPKDDGKYQLQSVDAVYQTKMGIKAVAFPEMRLDFDSVGKYEKTIYLELT